MTLMLTANAMLLACAGLVCASCAQGLSSPGPERPAASRSAIPTGDTSQCAQVVLASADKDGALPDFLAGRTTLCWSKTPAAKE